MDKIEIIINTDIVNAGMHQHAREEGMKKLVNDFLVSNNGILKDIKYHTCSDFGFSNVTGLYAATITYTDSGDKLGCAKEQVSE